MVRKKNKKYKGTKSVMILSRIIRVLADSKAGYDTYMKWVRHDDKRFVCNMNKAPDIEVAVWN